MNKLLKAVFFLLALTSICCLIAALYLFLIIDLKILSAIFLVFFPVTLYLALNLLQTNDTFLSINEKRVIKNVFPPFLSLFLSNILRKQERGELLFRGSEDLFRELIKKSWVYGEYGMGQSTILAMSNAHIKVFSVDSDRLWVKKIQSTCNEKSHNLKYVDLGVVRDWGYPAGYSKRQNIKTYLNYIWDMEDKPDLVLIDGRFRVASFLTSLRECKAGTKIIFDDYTARQEYHIVEEFIQPRQIFGLQALFEVTSKDNLDISKLDKLINKFEYVME
jgi:hypothetical protein